MDDANTESLLESSIDQEPALRQNEQANEEVQFLWSLYRKPTPCPDSDIDSGASEDSSDGSVQWEKNFVGKLVKVKKYSCRQLNAESERTSPIGEDWERSPVKQELEVSCESKPDRKCDNHQLQEPEDVRPHLNQDVTKTLLTEELLPSSGVKPEIKETSYQLQESEDLRPLLNRDRMGSPTNSQVSSTCDTGCKEEHCMSCLYGCEDTRQNLHNRNHQFSEVNRPTTSRVMEEQPGCSSNCQVSSSCDSNQLQGSKQLSPDVGTEDRGELNLGYVSRWMKESPGSQRLCEVSSSCGSESGDEFTGFHEQVIQNQVSHQRTQPNSHVIVTGTSGESEKMIESPQNCQVSSSCDSDSNTSGYSKLCLRVSEDSTEDDTGNSSCQKKGSKSPERSTDREEWDHADINVGHKPFKSVESKEYMTKHRFKNKTPLLPSHNKKKSLSQRRQLAKDSICDSGRSPYKHQQWTRDFPSSDRPARLRSQSPADRVGRWRRSQSPEEDCRRLRSRSVISVRDAQPVRGRKRRSKSCDPSASNNPIKRRSRSSTRRWSKTVGSLARHQSSDCSREKCVGQVETSNSVQCDHHLRTTGRRTKSSRQQMSGENLPIKKFKGFTEEIYKDIPQHTISKKIFQRIMTQSCDCPISSEMLQQIHPAGKTKKSRPQLTQGKLWSPNEVKMTSEQLGSSDSKNLPHRLSRKRKLSSKVHELRDERHTSRSLISFLPGPCGKQIESYIAESRLIEKCPSLNRSSLLRTCVACENQEHHSKQRVLDKFRQSAESVQRIPQSKKVIKNKSCLHQAMTCISHQQLGHSSAVNKTPAAIKTVYAERCDNFPVFERQRRSDLYSTGGISSIFKDVNASDVTMVKCFSQEQTCCVRGAMLQPNLSVVKPCSVRLENVVLSSLYHKYVSKYEKFVFPPFSHAASGKVSDFCLPQEYVYEHSRNKKQVKR